MVSADDVTHVDAALVEVEEYRRFPRLVKQPAHVLSVADVRVERHVDLLVLLPAVAYVLIRHYDAESDIVNTILEVVLGEQESYSGVVVRKVFKLYSGAGEVLDASGGNDAVLRRVALGKSRV